MTPSNRLDGTYANFRVMSTPMLKPVVASRDPLLAHLESAFVAAEFARITDDRDAAIVLDRQIVNLLAETDSSGPILDPSMCHVGDEVQNRHGDTGIVVALDKSNAQVQVRWDAPTPHASAFTRAGLLAGDLRFRQ